MAFEFKEQKQKKVYEIFDDKDESVGYVRIHPDETDRLELTIDYKGLRFSNSFESFLLKELINTLNKCLKIIEENNK